jgi:anti-anti-sigma regulatory factor
MSKILVARNSNLGFVKVVGRGSFQNSGCLKSFYTQVLRNGVDRFVIDLDACTYLDSTFLGTLLGLGLKLKDAGKGLLHILNASPRNQELLHNLGLDRLFIIGSQAAPANGHSNGANGNGALPPGAVESQQLKEIHCPSLTRVEAGPTILEAHEALMEFDPRNVPKFKDVVEFLREDLGQPAA